MHQHLTIKGVVRLSGKPRAPWLLGSFYLCALVFSWFSPLFGQEKVIQRVVVPIQSVLSYPTKTPTPQVNSALPGLGTLSDKTGEPLPPPVFAGSLELLQPETVYLPSIFVEGHGYVPLTHPSIQPYIDPVLLQNPVSDPAVVMIPTLVARQMESSRKTTLSFAPERESEPIVISAQTGWYKRIGNHDVYFLRGDCSFRQGQTAARSPEAVVWVATERDKTTNIQEITLYLESNSAQVPIRIEQNNSQQEGTKITDQKWLGRWYSRSPVDIMIASEVPPQEDPPIFKRALALMNADERFSFDKEIVQSQFLSSSGIPQLSEGANLRFREVQLTPRSDIPFSVVFEPYYPNDPAKGGIIVLTGGINLIIQGITNQKMLEGDTIDIAADNAVIWTENPGKIHGGGTYNESAETAFEIYLEGNIVYRDGPRRIEATRMYYDVKHKIAYILDGHLSMPISEMSGFEGSVRLKADILRQMGDGLFTAKNAMVTTSQLGEPTYSLRSQSLKLDRRGTGGNQRQVVIAENNYIAFRNVPVAYWPWIASDIEDPTFYLKNVSYGNSSRNGHTVKTQWDPFQILNIHRPDGVSGDVNVSWMEKRGIGHGVDFRYGVPSFAHIPGRTNGKFVYWGLYDQGQDKLGGIRKNVDFPNQYRHRLHWAHQQRLGIEMPFFAGPWDIRGEVSKVSDRNFMNSFFHSAWHTEENATTAVDLTHRVRNRSFTFSTEYALDNHYSNANWLPRFEHYWLGQSWLNDYLTWYGRTRVGFVDYRKATRPYDPRNDPFGYLPWEDFGGTHRDGVTLSTRHELDLPIQAGPVKVVPYVLGDASVWGMDQDQSGKAVDRLYGQTGVRMNLPIWKVDPRISSRTWYINGLAHKIDLDAEYMYAQANRDMESLILTDPLDYWSIDDFRRRYVFTNPAFRKKMFDYRFDPRYYALRSGMASNVTAGNMEIADDMQMFRLGTTHRFQTKRGSVGNRHILDWITVSSHVNLYPETEYNNGQGAGLLDYNILWHVGDRFSLFSEGLYDFFDDGQNLTRLGGIWNRPERGSFSLMVDQFSGLVERTYLSLALDYAMNEKYSMYYMTSYDLRQGQNVGHNFTFIRTGESFRLLVSAVYSEALSEWGFSLGIEPVFMRSSKRRAAVY